MHSKTLFSIGAFLALSGCANLPAGPSVAACRGRRLVRLIAGVLALPFAVALGAANRPHHPHRTQRAARQRAGSGYLSGRHDATTSTRDLWRVERPTGRYRSSCTRAGRPRCRWSSTCPGWVNRARPGRCGGALGQRPGMPCFAHNRQRSAKSIWSSERARRGDFAGIARDAYAAPALAKRVAVVRGLIDELQRRQEAGGETPYAQIDLTRIAVGGFDLGAGTALASASEPLPAGVKGVVALSPVGAGPQSDYRSVRLPVLVVTSEEDVDPYGLARTASARRVSLQAMPAGKKFLLVLSGAPHSLLSGMQQPQAVGAVLPRGGAATDGRERNPATRTTRTADEPRPGRPCKRYPAARRRPRPGRSSSRTSPASAPRTSTRSSEDDPAPRHGWRTVRNRGWEMTAIYSSSEGERSQARPETRFLVSKCNSRRCRNVALQKSGALRYGPGLRLVKWPDRMARRWARARPLSQSQATA